MFLKMSVLLCGLVLSSCSATYKKQEEKVEVQNDVRNISEGESHNQSRSGSLLINNDTLAINTKSAIFFQPDSLQMEKRMKQAGEDEFRAGADDYIYYINISAAYLEKQGLPVIDAKNKKFLKFLFADNSFQLVKLDTLPDLWGMYLFDPAKKPLYADIIEIENDYKSYFK